MANPPSFVLIFACDVFSGKGRKRPSFDALTSAPIFQFCCRDFVERMFR
ncbi:hypothetical protein TcasGA2_TC033021 [Tribolium castaneum]|uniref:Uncharacterized protein n=1 Tax=Tribolium castaneum TaxID=7070 RepID=A0A139WI41_TRICA|nr:hypothetical protein TcasGA2_TC033021 [Tribolium castaneum]